MDYEASIAIANGVARLVLGWLIFIVPMLAVLKILIKKK
jgi:hypothetical protein